MGREAVILRNLLKVTIDCSQAEEKPAHQELSDLFSSCAAEAMGQGIASFFLEPDGRYYSRPKVNANP